MNWPHETVNRVLPATAEHWVCFFGTLFAEIEQAGDQLAKLSVNYTMGDYKKPIECRHYPLCQGLQTVSRGIPPSFSGTHAIVLQKEAESICSECHDFDPKNMAEVA